MTPGDRIGSGERNTPPPPMDDKMEAIGGRIDLVVRALLADYVNRDGWSEAGNPHIEDSFKMSRVTVGLNHLMAIQWSYRTREDRYPRYPQVSLERRGDDDVVLKLWAPKGEAHQNRLDLGRQLHSATSLRVEMYGDFMLGKDPGKVEAWRAYRTCDASFPEV